MFVLKKILIEIKNIFFGRYFIKSYSQQGEDIILNKFFYQKLNGFYVDVGAHHPKRFSNTFYFYKKGWNGINIDAMPGSMRLFDLLRPRDINIEVPISNEQKELNYYMFNEPALNGFSKKISSKRNKIDSYYIISTKKLKTNTLNNVLNYNLKNNVNIDFLTIDVEGLDFEVLKSIDLKKHKPKVILIEILNNSLESLKNNQVTIYLKQYNYSIYTRTGNTFFYIKDDFYF